jgi:hypothetical protein
MMGGESENVLDLVHRVTSAEIAWLYDCGWDRVEVSESN